MVSGLMKQPSKNPVGRPKKYIRLQTVTGERTLTRRRIHQRCMGCGDEFSYLYPGTGAYRNICTPCKNEGIDGRPYGTH